MAPGMTPGLEVITDEDRIEAQILGEAGELQQLCWSELFGRSLVTDSEHENSASMTVVVSGFTIPMCEWRSNPWMFRINPHQQETGRSISSRCTK
jgi:hypothetical protein